MAMPSSRRVVQLIDAQAPGRPLTESYVYRDCPPSVLDTVEADWAKGRERAAWRTFEQNLLLGTVGGLSPLEHSHWNWRNKAESVAAGLHMLVAVESQSEVQGMMAVFRSPRNSHVSGKDVVYVDYLEAAPWNLKFSSNRPRFVGIGTVLIAEAIHLSLEMGLEGRVGLHSLPQAETFYEGRCRMSKFGADPNYDDLSYFEYTGQQAVEWVATIEEFK